MQTRSRLALACTLLTLSAATARAAAPSTPLAESRTLRQQVLLARAHFSPGEIDGRPGSNTALALMAFARERVVDTTGSVEDAAWLALSADVAPTLVNYTIAAEDVAGPFVEVPNDMMEKATLKHLGYGSAVEALGERFRSSPTLLRQLNPRASFAAGSEIRVPNVKGEPPAAAVSLRVRGREHSVSVLDADGKVLAWYPATIGGIHDPLPIGEWKIGGVSRNPIYNYNPELFWDANPEHAKAKVAAGPNNPVGTAWIQLSKPNYGIHGTPEPSMIGKTSSHGCVRLSNWDIDELATLVTPGITALLED